MRLYPIFTFLFLSNILFAQNSTKLFGDLQAGAGMTVNGIALYDASAGFNVILENQLYLRAGASLSLGGRLITPNSAIGYTCYDLHLGFNNDISESFRIVPYLGLGYQSVLATTRTPEKVVDDLNQITGIVDLEIAPRYETTNHKLICAPIGVDFHFNN